MSKIKVVIHFNNLRQLWQYAQAIEARSIEIRTKELLLICDCTEDDLKLIEKYGGTVVRQHSNEISN